jgi:hypothetical protein
LGRKEVGEEEKVRGCEKGIEGVRSGGVNKVSKGRE